MVEFPPGNRLQQGREFCGRMIVKIFLSRAIGFGALLP